MVDKDIVANIGPDAPGTILAWAAACAAHKEIVAKVGPGAPGTVVGVDA
jgi:hypothetical protein